MTTILGLDISSTQLNGCLLVDDQPPVLRCETLGKPSEPLIERLRRVPAAVWQLAHTPNTDPRWLTHKAWDVPDWIVIEQPAGKYGLQALLPILGAITACAPSECQVGWRKASEWRSDLGAKNTKQAGHDAVRNAFWVKDWSTIDLDEHELDAAGVAISWHWLLAANVLGATPRGVLSSRDASVVPDTSGGILPVKEWGRAAQTADPVETPTVDRSLNG